MRIYLLMQSHPAVAGLRGKSFAYLEKLTTVFGKDHAIGAGAETRADVVKGIDKEKATNADKWKFVKD